MKKNILVGFFAVLLVVVLISIFNRDTTVNIATIGNYSSRTSSVSIDTYRIIDYIAKELNEEGSDYSITKYNLSEFENYVKLKQAFESDNIDIIIGPNSTSEAEPLFAFLTSLDLPVFLTNVASDMYTGIDDNIFRINTNISEQADKITKTIVERNSKEPITIFYTEDNINFSLSFANRVKDNYSRLGVNVELVKVGQLDDKDVQDLLSLKVETDVVLIIAGPGKGGIITDIICSVNEDTTIYQTAWSKSDTTLEYMTNVSNEIYSIGFVAPRESEEYNDFVNNVILEKGWSKNVFTFTAYETMYFVDYVLNETKSMSVDDIKEIVYGLNIYQGHFYDFHFNSYGDGGKGFSLYQVVDNDYEMIVEYLD